MNQLDSFLVVEDAQVVAYQSYYDYSEIEQIEQRKIFLAEFKSLLKLIRRDSLHSSLLIDDLEANDFEAQD